jgi:outer membrane biosynthesis protein TonB
VSPEALEAVKALTREINSIGRLMAQQTAVGRRRARWAAAAVVLAILVGAGMVVGLVSLNDQGQQVAQQGEDLQSLLKFDAEDRAGRVQRFTEALEEIQEQFRLNDDADAARLEVVRSELLAAISAIDCSPDPPAQPSPLPRRREAASPPAPPAPPPPEQPEAQPSSMVLVPQNEPTCSLALAGLCVLP